METLNSNSPSTSKIASAAVLGFPVVHSLSPTIFEYWMASASINGQYQKIEVHPGELSNTLTQLKNAEYRGVNITIPLKIEALSAADQATTAARTIGAANCLTWDLNGTLWADNTDIIGQRGALEQSQRVGGFVGCDVVLIGAGGAARSMLYTLLSLDVGRITIFNRTKSSAESMAVDLHAVNPQVQISIGDWADLTEATSGKSPSPISSAQLVINSTSLGMLGQPTLPCGCYDISPQASVFDMVYHPLETQLLSQARVAGAETIHGLHMLVHQAAPAYQRWFGGDYPDVVGATDMLVQHSGKS